MLCANPLLFATDEVASMDGTERSWNALPWSGGLVLDIITEITGVCLAAVQRAGPRMLGWTLPLQAAASTFDRGHHRRELDLDSPALNDTPKVTLRANPASTRAAEKMREFMHYITNAFYGATGWNEDNAYQELNATARGGCPSSSASNRPPADSRQQN